MIVTSNVLLKQVKLTIVNFFYQRNKTNYGVKNENLLIKSLMEKFEKEIPKSTSLEKIKEIEANPKMCSLEIYDEFYNRF